MENKNNLQEQQETEERIDRNDNTTVGDDTLGENSEVTLIGEELENEEEDSKEDNDDSLDGGKAANNPAPDDDAQLDIETVSP